MGQGAASRDLRALLQRHGLPLLQVPEPEEEDGPRRADRIDLRPGGLVELLPEGGMGVIAGSWSSGKTSLALSEVAVITRDGGRAAVVDGSGWFFPPALTLLGGRLDRLLILRPSRERMVWAAEQLLRSGVFDLTLLLQPGALSRAALRRLQLATERGGGRALIVRRGPARAELAALRLQVEPGLQRRGEGASTIAAPPRTCRVQLVTRGSEGAAPPRWAEVGLA